MKEMIVEMAQMLLEMPTDVYMMCKYTLLSISREHPGDKKYFEKLFGLTDRKRLLTIEMKDVIETGGLTFLVTGLVEMESGEVVPMIGIKMMSDERWKQLTEQSAVKHFREWYGREPESVQEAFEGQRAYLENLGISV